MWKKRKDLNKTGMILAICKDNTGIYCQLLTVVIEEKKQTFYENGYLGSAIRVLSDKVMAGVYLNEICPDNIIEKFCPNEIVEKFYQNDD